jgi:hypothetical protein
VARYKHLPIYRTSYELLVKITRLSRNFQRDFKYTLGDSLREETVRLVLTVYRANSALEKEKLIEDVLEQIQILDLILRLSRDMHLVSTGAYSECVVLTDSLSQQAHGWKSAVSRRVESGQGRLGANSVSDSSREITLARGT